jgi:hypothetical protein
MHNEINVHVIIHWQHHLFGSPKSWVQIFFGVMSAARPPQPPASDKSQSVAQNGHCTSDH